MVSLDCVEPWFGEQRQTARGVGSAINEIPDSEKSVSGRVECERAQCVVQSPPMAMKIADYKVTAAAVGG